MLRLATSVSTWPFYNFRYRKLLFKFARRFQLYELAGSVLKRDGKKHVFKLMQILPFKRPWKVVYYVSPYFAQITINTVGVDVGTDKFYLSLLGWSLAMMHVIDVLLESFTGSSDITGTLH
jgi:hypothetical protein